MADPDRPILAIKDVKKHFPIGRGRFFAKTRSSIKAVDGVSLSLAPGQTLGLIGESGSGKTTLSRMILLIEEPTHGAIEFEGQDITALRGDERLSYRRQVQAVFQDPYSSLSPRMRVRDIILEPVVATGGIKNIDPRMRVRELLAQVGLDADAGDRFPHEFSGGQRQRIAVARALAVNPRLIMLDEPVSALDVSIRSQLLNLLKDLQAAFGLSYILITHDLSVVRYMSDKIAVMYLGKIMEYGDSDQVCDKPGHPYTRELLAAVFDADPTSVPKPHLFQGSVPSPLDLPPGCLFQGRCPHVVEKCLSTPPMLAEISPGHEARCHLISDSAMSNR